MGPYPENLQPGSLEGSVALGLGGLNVSPTSTANVSRDLGKSHEALGASVSHFQNGEGVRMQ